MSAFRPDQRLLDELAALEAQEWSGQVWRHTFADYPPEKTNLRGARWNPAGVEALYASLSRDTALAEAEHQVAIQPIRPTSRRTMHRLDIRVWRLLNLTEIGVLARLGIGDEELTGDDFTACQAIGGAAAYLELDGLLVPSARAVGTNIVVLFVDTEPSPVVVVLDSSPL